MDFNKTLSKLLGNNQKIDAVEIDERVVDEIVKIAINADPKEFVALLSGKIVDSILKITGLIFLPFEASDTSAVMQVFMMPMTVDAVGSVHSHPGPSNQPSNADLVFFGKNGYFHMIICRPYSQATIQAYDAFGTPMSFTIKDLGEEVDIKQWDDLDIDDEIFDEKLLKELKELEKEDDMMKKEMNSDNNITYTDNLIEDKPKEVESEIVNSQPHTVNIELEVNGEIINQELPLPPEYEPGDEIEVDIRTDKTPGDSIDEIILNVKKSPENLAENMIIDSDKSSDDIEKEIKEMESDIAKLKEENERLRNNLND